MTYQEAVLIRDKNLHLLNTIDAKGFTIDEIIIVPSDDVLRQAFFKEYLLENDPVSALQQFCIDNLDMEVWAIDTKHMRESNVLFYNKIIDSDVSD